MIRLSHTSRNHGASDPLTILSSIGHTAKTTSIDYVCIYPSILRSLCHPEMLADARLYRRAEGAMSSSFTNRVHMELHNMMNFRRRLGNRSKSQN